MASKKPKFTALGDILNTVKNNNEPENNITVSEPEQKNSITSEYPEKINEDKTSTKKKQKDKSQFITWSTYIRPEMEKKLKLKAVEEDKDIYKLVDEILTSYFSN